MTTKKHIGRRIRILRTGKKLTQEQFAKYLKVSPATVSGWEIGDIGISIEAAIRVAKFADVSLDWLLCGNKETPVNCPTDSYTSDEQQLLEDFREISEASRSVVLRLVKVMQK